MSQSNTIECPSCGHVIDVNELLYNQLKNEIEESFSKEKKQLVEQVREKALKEQSKVLQDLQTALKEKETEIENLAQARADIEQLKKEKAEIEASVKAQSEKDYKEKLKIEKAQIEKQLKETLEEEKTEQFESLNKELNEKSEKIKELNKATTKVAQLIREKDELKDALKAEYEQALTTKLLEEKIQIREGVENQMNLKLSEKELLISQLKDQLDETKRKIEQGSIQAQGEAQELVIEQFLTDLFPADEVTEIKKGERGADCLQLVNGKIQDPVGTIYYESKRTRAFQPSWIEKFKTDIRDKGADIGVLVTDVMPDDMDRMGLREGIWICTYEEFKGLCTVLRESLIQLSHAMHSQENKGDKMVMLYDFLTSNEFRMQVDAIVEGFTTMKTDLDSEKRSFQRIWKQREKQILKVLTNTTNMYASIRGIAGNAIQKVDLLELPEPDNSGELNADNTDKVLE
ncbi:MAG: DUF2130 domain-containing protein [Gammaproteobacteria bacterium]|nr:DUF2130 domain-containing protein [Gammaproteobacteria bacterium]